MITAISPLKLLTLGLAVIPSGGQDSGKAPLIDWAEYQNRLPTDSELEDWENRLHPSLWGLVASASNILPVDIDKPEQQIMMAGLNPHVKTPKGWHYYFKRPPGLTQKLKISVLPGVDIPLFVNVMGTRRDGGKYEILILPTPDNIYSFDQLPPAIKAALNLNGHQDKATASVSGRVTKGARHDTMVRRAGQLRHIGLSPESIEATLLQENQERYEPMLPEEEVHSIAFSMGKYAPAPAQPEIKQKNAPNPPQVFNANAAPSRKDVPHLFEVEGRGKMIAEGQHSTLFSQGGSGKSITAADYLPLIYSNGITDIPFSALGEGAVLVCDWETELETHRRYITAIKKSIQERNNADLDAGLIHYIQFTDPITAHANFIRDFIKEHNIKLVVIDSQLAAMAGAFSSLKDEQLAGVYYNILTSWHVTTLTIDHVPKSNMNNDNSTGAAFGSVVKYNRARSVFEMKQAQEPGDNFIEVAFIHQKNNLGAKLKPFGLRIEFENDKDGDLDKVNFMPLDLSDSAKLEKIRPLWERARDAILWNFNGQASVKQLAEDLTTTEGTIRDCLNRYKEVFTKVGGDRDGAFWGVTTRVV